MKNPSRHIRRLLPAMYLIFGVFCIFCTALLPAADEEVLCYNQRVTDAASFNIYTGRNDANNPIVWNHSVPAGILERVVRVGLYIEAWDVDAPPVDDEHDRVYFNGYDLGLLEGYNNTWITVEKTVPLAAIRAGANELRVSVDELGKQWKVTIRASELRFYCSTAEADFSIGVSPAALTLPQGGQGDATVTLTSLNGFDQAVALNVSGLPDGVGATWSANPSTPTPLAESGLRLTVGPTVPVGEYSLLLQGSCGGLHRECTLQLTVVRGAIEPVYQLDIQSVPETGRPPLTVDFSALFRVDPPPSATEYAWDFGDGSQAQGRTVRHVFERPGLYTVVLTAALPGGPVLRAEKKIEVLDFSGRISLAFSRAQASAGERLRLSLFVNNPEVQDIADLKLKLPLDGNLILERVEGGLQPVLTSPRPVWHIPLLRGGQTLEIILAIRVAADAAVQTISQTAELDQAGFARVIVAQAARLRIVPAEIELSKSVDLSQAEPGQELLYTLRLRYPGFIDLPEVSLSDSLPAQLDFVSAQGPWPLQRQGNSLTWTGTVKSAAQLEWQIRARLRNDLFDGEQVRNTAELLDSVSGDKRSSNTVITVVQGRGVGQSQVQLEHRAELPQTEVGRLVRLRLTLTNRSASTLIEPRLEILLPSGLEYVAGSSLLDGASLADPLGRGRIVYRPGAVAAGRSLTLQYQVVIGAASRRGLNLCRAELYALDASRSEVRRSADARVNVSASGLVFMSGLEGRVFLDRDRNGFYSGADQDLAGVEVALSNGDRTFSDEQGKFAIDQLYPGEYAVGVNTASLDERYRIPPPNTHLVTLSDGLCDWVELPLLPADSGDETVSSARFEGRVFFDKNRNGAFDEGVDPLLEEFEASLDGRMITRGRNGRFVLTRLNPGTHGLEIVADGCRHQQTVELRSGTQTVDIALKFSGIRITIQGEKK